jgi:hypothetical protein
MTICTIENCGSKSDARGLCGKHYQRWKVHGSPEWVPTRSDKGHLTAYGYRARTRGGVKILDHTMLAEKAIGHALPPGAEVHHVNGDRADNNPSNLVVCPNHAYHLLLHVRQRAMDASGDPEKRRCCICKQYDDPQSMLVYRSRGGQNWRHAQCQRDAAKARYYLKKETQ